MTFDERLEKLRERHEALTQSVELLLLETRELRGIVEVDAQSIRELRATVSVDAENIRALARIADS